MERSREIWLIAIFAIVIVLAVGAAAFFSGTVSPQGNFKATTVPPITAADWQRGNKTANVSVIEYGDYQCPACAQYEAVLKQLEAKYGDRVVFVFRHFPLYQIHSNARISSQAAEAAGVQGKYWEMHDLIYQKQQEWEKVSTDTVVAKYFDGYAASLGLDVSKFNADVNSDAVKAKVQKDLDSGNAAAVDHTPTFFINLTQIPNPTSYEQFAAVLESALASSSAPSTGSGQAAR